MARGGRSEIRIENSLSCELPGFRYKEYGAGMRLPVSRTDEYSDLFRTPISRLFGFITTKVNNTMKGIGPYSARIDRPLCRGVPHVFPPAENPEPGHGRKAVVPRPSRPDGRSAFHSACLPAGVLATVLVVSALMLLSVLGVLALWESDFLFFSRAGYLSRQRANVESAFVLYAADSTLTARLDEQGGLRLYDGLPDSRVRIAVRPWGLYEAVRVEAADSRITPTRLFGSAAPFA